MFILHEKQWPRMLVCEPTPDWGDGFTEDFCVMEKRLLELLTGMKEKEEKFVFVYVCKAMDLLPYSILARIVKVLLFNRQLLADTIEFSIAYGETDEDLSGLNYILQFYTPSRPLHVVKGKVELEAMLANDYKVEVALLSNRNPRAKGYHAQYISSFYRTLARAKGNVRDQTNMQQLRIPIDENTGQFVYSADFQLQTLGLEINGEFARSALHSRFPAHADQEPTFAEGARSAERGNAYFLNVTRWFGPARFGGEYFSINPEFQTEMRTFLDPSYEIGLTNLYGLANRTLYWQLVDDNEDGDAYPDRRIGNLPGLINDAKAYDIDGVFPGQDEDHDGTPRTNRNLNTAPDYEEPFLMFDIEPNEYIYGLDRNNNDEPDFREDDGAVDYPYDYDQRGFHLFGQLDLTSRWKLAVGLHRVGEVAGGGRNRSSYAILSFRREGVAKIRRIFFENHLRRVQDDISDEYVVVDESPRRQGHSVSAASLFTMSIRTDRCRRPVSCNGFAGIRSGTRTAT